MGSADGFEPAPVGRRAEGQDHSHGPAVRRLRPSGGGVPGRRVARGENLHAAHVPTRTEAFSEIVYQPDTIAPAPVTRSLPSPSPSPSLLFRRRKRPPPRRTPSRNSPRIAGGLDYTPTPPQDRVDATPRRDRAAHPRSWFMKTSCDAPSTWRPARRRLRSWPPAGGRAIFKATGPKPHRLQSGNVTISTDARGRVSTQHRRRRTKLHPFLRHGRSLPPRNPAVAAPWPYRAAFLGPPLCHSPSRPRKTP